MYAWPFLYPPAPAPASLTPFRHRTPVLLHFPFASCHLDTYSVRVIEIVTRFHLASGESLRDASRDRVVALVFLRHFGCTFTRRILKHLQELQAECQTHDARLVLVHMLQSGAEHSHLRSDDVDRIADPDCELYRAFGLGRGGFWELLGPVVWVRGFLSVFSGCGVGHLAGDGRQMPGTFLLRDGEIIAARPARNASELPDIDGIFQDLP